jgi:predicted component of type VI protein secretion system
VLTKTPGKPLEPGGGAQVDRGYLLKSVAVLADLVGANAPKVSVQVQAQVPTREEAIAIAIETLEAFAPELLARQSPVYDSIVV